MRNLSTLRALTLLTFVTIASAVLLPSAPGFQGSSDQPGLIPSTVGSHSISTAQILRPSIINTINPAVSKVNSPPLESAIKTPSRASIASIASAGPKKVDPFGEPPVSNPSNDPPENPHGPAAPTVPEALTSAQYLVDPEQPTAVAASAQVPEVPKAAKSSPSTIPPSESQPAVQSPNTPPEESPSVQGTGNQPTDNQPQAASASAPSNDNQPADSRTPEKQSSEPQGQSTTANIPQSETSSQSLTEEQAPNTIQEASDGQVQANSQAKGTTRPSIPDEDQVQVHPVLTADSSTYAYSIDSASHLIIGKETALPGGPAVTVNGVKIALAASADSIIVAGSTMPVQTSAPSTLPEFHLGNEVITANSASQYVVHGLTLLPGASAITIDGTPISLGPHATQVMVGSSTIKLHPANFANFPTLTVNGQLITANSADQYIVGGQTIRPGAPAVTIAGTPISIPADFQMTRPSSGIITAGSKAYPYTLNSAHDIVFASKTLVPGGSPITLGRETISEAADGSSMVIVSGGATRTQPLVYPVTPAGSLAFEGSYAFTSSNKFNSSVAPTSGLVASSASGSSLIITATGKPLPPINPTNLSGASNSFQIIRDKIGFTIVVAFLAMPAFWLR